MSKDKSKDDKPKDNNPPKITNTDRKELNLNPKKSGGKKGRD